MKKTLNIKLSGYKILHIASILLISMSISMAQQTNLSLVISLRSSGNGLGSFITPELCFRKNRNEIAVGANFQKNHMNLCGFKTSYNYTAYSGNDCDLFIFLDIDYSKNAYLSKGFVKLESVYHPEYSSYYQNLRINVLEQHAGFGIRFLKRKFFNCYAAIGGGAFCTLNLKQSELFRFRDVSGSSLLLKFGARLNIISRNKLTHSSFK